MDFQVVFARRPEHGDVTLIPTPPQQAKALFVNFFLPILALLVVCLRTYSRIHGRQFGVDDWLIWAAMIFSAMMCITFYMYIKLSYIGWHMEDVPADYNSMAGQWWFFLGQLFYNPVLALVKASVLLFLLRLGGHKPRVRWCIHALNTFNGLQAVAIFIVAALQCLPIEANWNPAVRATATCVDNSFHVVISCLTLLTDILVLALPFWIFLGLKMPKAVKIAVLGVFMLGLGVLIITIVRLVNLVNLFYFPETLGSDPFYPIGVVLNVVEINIAIISASGPALRGLFRSMFPKLFGSGGSSGKYTNSAGQHLSNPYGTGTTRSAAFRGDKSHHGGHNRHSSIPLKSMGGKGLTEIRSSSPSGSEEEIMTYNGIMRTTDVQVNFESDSKSDGPKVDARSIS